MDKNELTTGAWQQDIGCPISIVLLSISDGCMGVACVPPTDKNANVDVKVNFNVNVGASVLTTTTGGTCLGVRCCI
jgi:hypothetical protein